MSIIVNKIVIFRLDVPRKDGKNAAIMITFEGVKGLPSVISINFDGKTIALNDEGLLPDEEAGDGVHSAFLAFDFDKQVKREESFKRRAVATRANQVSEFSGRSLIDSQLFSIFSKSREPASLPPRSLRDGTTLIHFAPPFDDVPTLPIAHDETRSLMITDPDVTADSGRTFDPCDVDGDGSLGNVNGAWSFKTLITNMAPPGSGQQFTHNWLREWMTLQTVNTFDILARTNIQNFFPGWDGVNASTLDMNSLPFRLLAIVNRIDLAKTSAYGTTGNPGEIRFVFGLVDQNSGSCSSGNLGSTRQMTVIFEYGDINGSCTAIKDRANQWIDLSDLALGSPAYNAALQIITDDVTQQNAVPSKPNRSALNQLRTNEIALSFPWQLREFVIDAVSTNLISATIKQTPDPDMFRSFFAPGSATMALYMEQNAIDILCESHVVPELFKGLHFLGSHADYGFGTIWISPTNPANLPSTFPACHQTNVSLGTPSVQGEVRHKFSLNTCDDCHSGETNTAFTHVKPGTFPTALSGFLTGIVVNDPAGEPVKRKFNDLLRRGQILEDLAVKSCISDVFIAGRSDPFVLSPLTEPVFRFEPSEADFSKQRQKADFSRLQQRHTFAH